MLPPDSVHVFHTNDPVYSLHFQTPDRLLAGTKTGCLQLWDLVVRVKESKNYAVFYCEYLGQFQMTTL